MMQTPLTDLSNGIFAAADYYIAKAALGNVRRSQRFYHDRYADAQAAYAAAQAWRTATEAELAANEARRIAKFGKRIGTGLHDKGWSIYATASQQGKTIHATYPYATPAERDDAIAAAEAWRAEQHAMRPPRKPHRTCQDDDAVCTVCGVALAMHWRCKKCGALGHLCGRSATFPDHCDECVHDARRRLAQHLRTRQLAER